MSSNLLSSSMFASLKAALIAVPLITQNGFVMAQNQNAELLSIEDSSEVGAKFSFDEMKELEFASVELKDFLWNKSNTPVRDFDDAKIFSEFREAYHGYDPVNRDRGEIRIYSARIIPEKVGLAADYARFLAAEWGPLNFGVEARSPVSGEVMTGRKTQDGQDFTRLSVFRRGDGLLIIRSDVREEEWPAFGKSVAAFVGSVEFADQSEKDVIVDGFKTVGLDVPAAAGNPGAISPLLPANWRELDITNPDPTKGVFKFFVDGADEAANSGTMLYSMDVGASGDKIDEKTGLGLSRELLEMFLKNVLPDQPNQIEPLNVSHFDDFGSSVDFNAYYSFKVDFPKIGKPGGGHVLLTRRGNQIVGFASIAASPSDMYHRGAGLHPTLVNNQLRVAIKEYWTASEK